MMEGGVFVNSGQNLGTAISYDVALGDVDEDGDLDAYVASDGPNWLWLNNGIGVFSPGQGLGGEQTRGVALGDLDGDGDLDAFDANIHADAVWINDGTGHFDSRLHSFNDLSSRSIALGDLDNDGDLDAFIANQSSQPDEVWINKSSILMIGVLGFDNNLSSLTDQTIESFRLGTQQNPNVRAVLLVDRFGDQDSEVVEISGGIVTYTHSIPCLPGVYEVDVADPDTLAGFLQWARETYPSMKTLVSFIGHGTGPAPEIVMNTRAVQSQFPPLPRMYWRRPLDVTNGSYLSTPDLGRALALATNNGAQPFDMVFFDQCFAGNLDVLYEVRQAAQVFVASPNYVWGVFPYDAYLPHFSASASTEAMAQAIIEEYQAALDDSHPNAIFWLHASDIDLIADAVTQLGDALRSEISANESLILDASLHSQFVDTTLALGDLELAAPDELIGLGSFAHNLKARFPVGSPVYLAAEQVLARLVNISSTARVGSPWVNPAATWVYTDTLTVMAPLTRTLSSDVIWRASVYTSTTPLDATWSVLTQTVPIKIVSPLAYTVDGRWDNFLSAWYTDLDHPQVGLFFPVMPPPLLITTTEALTLTARVNNLDTVYLDWSEAENPELQDYAIYVRYPNQTIWEIWAVLPYSQTYFEHSGLYAGQFSYFVIGRNASNTAIARSAWLTAEQGTQPVIGLSASSGFASIQLDWNAIPNPAASGYRIYRSSGGSQVFDVISTTLETLYTDGASGMAIGESYCYLIEAENGQGAVLAASNTACASYGQVELFVPQVSALISSTVIIPVNIQAANGLRVAASDIWIEYDNQIISITNIVPTALTMDYLVNYGISSQGHLNTVKVGMVANNTPPAALYGDGSLFWIEAQVLGSSGDAAPIRLIRFQEKVGGTNIYHYQPGEKPIGVPLRLGDGALTIRGGYILGDVSGNGVIDSIDAYLALQIAVGSLSSPEPEEFNAADVNGSGQIEAADATMILYYATHGQWPSPVSLSSVSLDRAHTAAAEVQLSLVGSTGMPGKTLEITLAASNLANIAGGQFVIAYDPSVVSDVVDVSLGDLTNGFSLSWKVNSPGLLNIAVASGTGSMSGDGVVLKFTLLLNPDAPSANSNLKLADAQLNDPYGRDFQTSALQGKIVREDGEIVVGPIRLFLPGILK